MAIGLNSQPQVRTWASRRTGPAAAAGPGLHGSRTARRGAAGVAQEVGAAERDRVGPLHRPERVEGDHVVELVQVEEGRATRYAKPCGPGRAAVAERSLVDGAAHQGTTAPRARHTRTALCTPSSWKP